MTGVETYHRELSNKGYGHGRAGLVESEWEGVTLRVMDPFNNRIGFREAKTSQAALADNLRLIPGTLAVDGDLLCHQEFMTIQRDQRRRAGVLKPDQQQAMRPGAWIGIGRCPPVRIDDHALMRGPSLREARGQCRVGANSGTGFAGKSKACDCGSSEKLP